MERRGNMPVNVQGDSQEDLKVDTDSLKGRGKAPPRRSATSEAQRKLSRLFLTVELVIGLIARILVTEVCAAGWFGWVSGLTWLGRFGNCGRSYNRRAFWRTSRFGGFGGLALANGSSPRSCGGAGGHRSSGKRQHGRHRQQDKPASPS